MKSPDTIREQTRRLMRKCAAPHGGYSLHWMLTIARIHNEYMANICTYLGLESIDRASDRERFTPLHPDVYRRTWTPF